MGRYRYKPTYYTCERCGKIERERGMFAQPEGWIKMQEGYFCTVCNDSACKRLMKHILSGESE